MEQKKSELKASLHVKKGQPLPDCPFRLKVTGKTNVDVIVGDEAVTKKVQKKHGILPMIERDDQEAGH
ncbi:hypothetical protein [Megasphaera sp.]|uniref:hypothetical protein n=1 Tax=Megasphaera sp. TaxID=2023260 RepID=UPI00307EBEF6